MVIVYPREVPAGPFAGGSPIELRASAAPPTALYKDRIYHSTGDAHVIALNAGTGKMEWDTVVRDYKELFRSATPSTDGNM